MEDLAAQVEPAKDTFSESQRTEAPATCQEKNDLNEEKEVVVQLADGISSELYVGVSSFEDLGIHQDLLKGVYGMGFKKPSKIQEKALPLLLMNPPRNFIGQSQSGTGKTAAFVLAMLSRIDLSSPETQALCLSPARELARQSMDVLREMGKYASVTTAYAIREAVAKGNITFLVIKTPQRLAIGGLDAPGLGFPFHSVLV
jgi:ATP-dependent RNA helicase DDX19/DBP5